ncbi:MAG TPA: hypothetical protein VK472_02205, partial [Allosphingosinicella sp.]|nr:hypothetical protein [Allosphingosinicella sp.]
LLLAACDGAPAPKQKVAAPAPELCSQASKALDQLKAKGAIDYDSKGEASIPQDAWMRMGAAEHSQFARMLAFHAACASPDGAAQRQVRIRNESGIILLENMVPVTIDLGGAD